MSATRIILKFTVDHGDVGCGEPWDTAALTTSVLANLTEQFLNDNLHVEAIAATEVE